MWSTVFVLWRFLCFSTSTECEAQRFSRLSLDGQNEYRHPSPSTPPHFPNLNYTTYNTQQLLLPLCPACDRAASQHTHKWNVQHFFIRLTKQAQLKFMWHQMNLVRFFIPNNDICQNHLRWRYNDIFLCCVHEKTHQLSTSRQYIHVWRIKWPISVIVKMLLDQKNTFADKQKCDRKSKNETNW